MSGSCKTIPVLAAPMFDPAVGRVDLHVPDGLTLAEILAISLPSLREEEWPSVRMSLVNRDGSILIDQRYWHRVRPRQGAHVVIRIVPGKDAIRSILSLVVAVAAAAFSGGALATTIGGALGIGAQAGGALLRLGITALGNLAINALIPPPEPDKGPENSYVVSGFRNELDPDGAIPVPLGKIRYAPKFACRPYNQIINGDQHIVSIFLFGYGPLNITDLRLGESSLGEYDEVELEVRDGLLSDLPVSLVPRQVVEENVGTQLTRPLPRDDLGEIEAGQPATEKPIVRASGADAAGVSVLLTWPTGLGYINSRGKKRFLTQNILIEQRLAGAATWQEVLTLNVVGEELETFYRQHSWEFPSRGKWEVRLTMLTDEFTGDNVQQRAMWSAIQTLRPEYPINIAEPMALVALRIKATDQLNGQLDDLNAVVARVVPDWDYVSETWIERETSNPASHYRYLLQSAANAKPVGDEGIDLDQLQDWHDFCRIKGLEYNRVMDAPEFSMREALTEVAAAGRASPRHDGIKWGVTIDRPQDLVVDHISARNATGFKRTRSYFEAPDGFRIKFKDETNEYRDAERVVPWPGHVGDIVLTEQLQLPGKTNPDEIYREGRRRAYESLYRPDSYEALQDGPARVATRGDLVMASHHVLSSVQASARVNAVNGRLISVDEELPVSDGIDYAIRFRFFQPWLEGQSSETVDTIGTSVVREVSGFGEAGDILTLKGSGETPKVGDIIHFGPVTRDSRPLIVRGVEAAEDATSQLTFIDAAPEIDEVLDGEVIPPWSGRVGAEIAENLVQPAAPIFTSVVSGLRETDFPGLVIYRIAAGPGAVVATSFEVEHKLDTATEWTSKTIPAANGGGKIDAYTTGDVINLRALGRSESDVPGPLSGVVTLTVGENDADIPAALDGATFALSGGLGGVSVAFASGNDAAATAVQIYISTSATADRETDATGAPIEISPNRTYEIQLGDGTRDDVLAGVAWTLGTGWSLDGSGVDKTPGTASSVSKTYAFEAGKQYRIGYGVEGRTAGTVQPRLTGGSTRNGVVVSADGDHLDRVQAVTGNDTLEFLADASFDGGVDDLVMIVETDGCLDQGTYYVWIEPQNEDGAPGPMSGPLSIQIV